MGLIGSKIIVKIVYKNRKISQIELNSNKNLKDTRLILNQYITFPFIYLDGNNNEIVEQKESLFKIEDILDGKTLYIKKKLNPRKLLGEKIDSKDDLFFYLYPKPNFSIAQKKSSTNILIIGETGVGKSTWIHSLLNHLEKVDIDENCRYVLFDEKKMQSEYESKYGKKNYGSSVTDKPEIYEIPSTETYPHSLKLIDTCGFGDTRGNEYDNKIIEDIKNLFDNSRIENLKAICLFFKASETRNHSRTNYIINKLLSLFSDDFIKNFIIIFTFTDSLTNIPAINVLKGNLIFEKIYGDIENIPKFYFNSFAYFTNDRINYDSIYGENTRNFNNFLKYLNQLEPISLENSKIIINYRIHFETEFKNISNKIEDINKKIKQLIEAKKNLVLKKNNILDYYNRPKVLYCKKHDRICNKNYLKIYSFFESNFGFFGVCYTCKCSKEAHKAIDNYDDYKERKKNKDNFNNVELSNEEFCVLNNKIYHFLMKCLETFKILIKENKEINKIALVKQNEKEEKEYLSQILNLNIKDNNKITKFLRDNLQSSDSYDEDELENFVNKFINSLL